MNPSAIISTEAARDGFYPTPPSVAEKMLAGVDLRYVGSVLEPSAGKGNLIDALAKAQSDGRHALDVDCCEIDPALRQVCRYNFGEERERELYAERNPLDRMGYGNRSAAQEQEYKRLSYQIRLLNRVNVHIVHDDFLTYRTHKHYDLILMNPPFADGERHLLRALDMQKDGGSIVCLLNAETIRNPYTATRALLIGRLNELGAEIQYIEDAFSKDAERKADVDVAIVKVHIPTPERESEFFKRMKEAVDQDIEPDPEIQALVAGDYIEQAIQMYRVEVDATMAFIREYRALSPYMAKSFGEDGPYGKDPILKLVVDNDSTYGTFDYHKYMRMVRLKYWRALFKNPKFTGRLTSALQDQYQHEVEKMADYEFSAFNIKQVLVDMNAAMVSGVERAVLDLFEKLTVEHTWYPECSVNRHYFNGWKTNKAHKIGKKCIIPTYGMFSSYSWSRESFNVSEAYKVISDIEKAFDYLDGGRTDECDLMTRLQVAESGGVTRNIHCKYFRIDLFKKGTTHIKFHPEAMDLVERLNIYASRKKNWLPPNYGKSDYASMQEEERAVVDSFHGDGTEGSGESAYVNVMQKAAFFLAEPTQKLPSLMAPAEE